MPTSPSRGWVQACESTLHSKVNPAPTLLVSTEIRKEHTQHEQKFSSQLAPLHSAAGLQSPRLREQHRTSLRRPAGLPEPQLRAVASLLHGECGCKAGCREGTASSWDSQGGSLPHSCTICNAAGIRKQQKPIQGTRVSRKPAYSQNYSDISPAFINMILQEHRTGKHHCHCCCS